MENPRELVVPAANSPSGKLQAILSENQEKLQQPVLHMQFYSVALSWTGLAPIASKGDSLLGTSTAATLWVLGQCKS